MLIRVSSAFSLPLNIPETPAFEREKFAHRIKTLVENVVYDDLYHLNTQSGTQWDGFRHVGGYLCIVSVSVTRANVLPVRPCPNANFLQRGNYLPFFLP